MIRILAIATLALTLAACETSEQKQAKWVGYCSTHGFTADQCGVLYSLRKDIADDKASAEDAGLITGIAIGGSSGSK